MIARHLHLQISLVVREVHWAWSNRASALERLQAWLMSISLLMVWYGYQTADEWLHLSMTFTADTQLLLWRRWCFPFHFATCL